MKVINRDKEIRLVGKGFTNWVPDSISIFAEKKNPNLLYRCKQIAYFYMPVS